MRATHQPEEQTAAVVAESRSRARDLLFDYLAVTGRGAVSGPAVAAHSAVAGDGPAIVDGTDRRSDVAGAALVNGIAAHSIEFDDTYEPASLHPGVVVWPAVLALADERGATLGEVLDAGIAAYDVVCAVGARLDSRETYARGFHPTGVCGPIGAAVGASRMLGLDVEQERHAIGIAASAAAGLLEFLVDGAWTKPFHAGQASASGITAARLAAAGYSGPAAAIEGAHGFLHAFGAAGETASLPLEPPPWGSGMRGTALKLYPCCRYTHGNIDLLLEVARDENLDPADVESISCGVLASGWSLVADPIAVKRRIAGPVDAQFSMPFAAALALTTGTATLDGFTRAGELAPTLAPLMQRVSCHRSERLEAAFPANWGGEIVIRTRGGAVIERHAEHVEGSPARPVSHGGLLDKATGLIGEIHAARLLDRCLTTLEDTAIAELGRGAAAGVAAPLPAGEGVGTG